uniref:Uncharacterized protein n=1 Tax=Ditylenchus dipsaci TaxID=166011 RepID=A0A915EHD2_9BILA
MSPIGLSSSIHVSSWLYTSAILLLLRVHSSSQLSLLPVSFDNSYEQKLAVNSEPESDYDIHNFLNYLNSNDDNLRQILAAKNPYIQASVATSELTAEQQHIAELEEEAQRERTLASLFPRHFAFASGENSNKHIGQRVRRFGAENAHSDAKYLDTAAMIFSSSMPRVVRGEAKRARRRYSASNSASGLAAGVESIVGRDPMCYFTALPNYRCGSRRFL